MITIAHPYQVEEWKIGGQVKETVRYYSGVYILLATVCTCVRRLLQLAVMTERTLLITCCGLRMTS